MNNEKRVALAIPTGGSVYTTASFNEARKAGFLVNEETQEVVAIDEQGVAGSYPVANFVLDFDNVAVMIACNSPKPHMIFPRAEAEDISCEPTGNVVEIDKTLYEIYV